MGRERLGRIEINGVHCAHCLANSSEREKDMNENPEINIDKKNEIPENCNKCGRKLVKKMKDEDNLLTCPNCGNTIDMGID